jgi:hypothetical protein
MKNLNESYVDKSYAETLLEKWAPVLDYKSDSVKEISNENTRMNTAILLESQEQWCNESNTAGAGGSLGNGGSTGTTWSGDNYASGDSRLPKILIPMIRRTFPELITNEIVGVQPMSGPVGLAFAMRYKYQDEGLGQGGVDGWNGGKELPTGSAHASQPVQYGSGKGENELGYQHLDSRFTGVSSTQLSGLSGEWEFADQDRGVAEILENFEITSNIPQVEVTFEKTAVQAGTRRLGARWSVELEQDLKNMNGIDVDSEITNAMSYEIQAEIDREMIMRMAQAALNSNHVTSWSPKNADGRWLVERNRDFYQRLIIEANRIAVRNRRGAANFVVATPRVCSILEMLPEFQWVPVQGDVNTQPVGIAKVGSVGGRFNVYRDTRTEVQNTSVYGTGNGYAAGGTNDGIEYALLGYKGPEFYDTGIIYCPYIPIMVQRTVGPQDFAPRVGLLTRYGVVDNIFGSDLYYHIILVKDLGTAFDPAGANTTYF